MAKKVESLLLVLVLISVSILSTVPISVKALEVSTMNGLCPIWAYPACDESFPVYTTVDCTTKAGTIYKDDYCKITKFYKNADDKFIVKVTYPTSSGDKTAYAKAIRFVPECYSSFEPYKVTATAKTYVSTKAGTATNSSWYISSGDKFYVIERDDSGNAQVAYPVSGGYKMGWIKFYDVKYNANSGSGAPSTQRKIQNANLTLSSTKPTRTGYTFQNWNTAEDGSGTKYSAGGTYKANSAVTLYAQWKINSYTLTVTSSNAAMGTVSGGGTYNYNATATIKATPKTGYKFVKWSDGNTSASRTVTITGAKTYTATFEPINYTVAVMSANATMGTTSGGGTYAYGSTITIKASANTGHTFEKWNDGNTSSTRTVTVLGATTYTAYFNKNNYTITANCVNLETGKSGNVVGTVSGTGTYSYGSTVKLIANASSGNKFSKWSDGVTESIRDVTIWNNAEYIAYFVVDQNTCEHIYGEEIIDKEPTCTTTGEKHAICAECKYVKYDVIASVPHNSEIITVQPTCTETGRKYERCKVCDYETGNETISALGHNLSYNTIDPTCTDAGVCITTCIREGCDYSEREEIDALGHSYSEEWIVIVEPTCTQQGEKAHVCGVEGCGEQVDNTFVEATGHNYTVSIQEPTENSLGIRRYECIAENCGYEYVETFMNEIRFGTIAVGYAFSIAGDTVTIPIKIQDNQQPGIAGFTFKIHYDNKVLMPIEGTKGYVERSSLTSTGTLACNLNQSEIDISTLDYAQVHWEKAINDANITANGELFTLKFRVSDTAEQGNYPINLTYESGGMIDGNKNNIVSDVINGNVVVAEIQRGDVNLDQNVDDHDCNLLAQYITKWKDVTFTDAQFLAGDVHIDNRINTKDGVRLAQLRAGYQFETESAITELFAEGIIPEITVGIKKGIAGRVVHVPVSIRNNTGIAGFNFNINYDAKSLIPVEIVEGELLGECTSNLQQEEIDKSTLETINVYWTNTNNLTKNGILFEVAFLIKDSASVGDVLPVNISYENGSICNDSLTDLNVNIVDGSIKIIDTEFVKYEITGVSIFANDGTEITTIPVNGDFNAQIAFESLTDEIVPGKVFLSAYDKDGNLIGVASKDITLNMLLEGVCDMHIPESESGISWIKVFIWDSVKGLTPLAEQVCIKL